MIVKQSMYSRCNNNYSSARLSSQMPDAIIISSVDTTISSSDITSILMNKKFMKKDMTLKMTDSFIQNVKNIFTTVETAISFAVNLNCADPNSVITAPQSNEINKDMLQENDDLLIQQESGVDIFDKVQFNTLCSQILEALEKKRNFAINMTCPMFHQGNPQAEIVVVLVIHAPFSRTLGKVVAPSS